ncbi:hypothetical protein [Ottowia sp.]|uniref:hypothetical protein n=1 Tax=Ottowia sp. TaxID=1898956 RepID=UPI003A87F65A
MTTPSQWPERRAWACALVGALALHVAVFLGLRTPYRQPPKAPPQAVWHVSLRAAPVPPAATPAPVPSVAATRPPPAPRVAAKAPARVVPPPVQPPPPAAPEPEPLPPAQPEPEPPPPLPPTPELSPPPSSVPPVQWLDANHADQAPAPQDNTWLLAQHSWPAQYPQIRVQLWISASGRMERFELEGGAADDPQVRALFAPFIDTPMLPAMIGRVPVPSTMRVELWMGQDMKPDFIGPLSGKAQD